MKVDIKLYVVMNKNTFNFLNEDGEQEEKIEHADKFFSKDVAMDLIKKCDNQSDFEIREIDVTYKLGKLINYYI